MEADADPAFDTLPAEPRATVFLKLRKFPSIGRRYQAQPPQSAEALAQLAALPTDAPQTLREYRPGDFLIRCAAIDADATAYLLSIRHHRQLSSAFARLRFAI